MGKGVGYVVGIIAALALAVAAYLYLNKEEQPKTFKKISGNINLNGERISADWRVEDINKNVLGSGFGDSYDVDIYSTGTVFIAVDMFEHNGNNLAGIEQITINSLDGGTIHKDLKLKPIIKIDYRI